MNDTQNSIVVEGTRGKVRPYGFTEFDDDFGCNLHFVRLALNDLENARKREQVKHLLGTSGVIRNEDFNPQRKATVIEITGDANLVVYAGEFGEFEIHPEDFVPGSDPPIRPDFILECDPDEYE